MNDEQNDLSSYPSLAGKFANRGARLTPQERAVAKFQGLLNDDGTLKEEAIAQPEQVINLPPGVSAPVPLESLVENAEEVEEQIRGIKGDFAKEAVVDGDKQLGEGLQPPDFSEGDGRGAEDSDGDFRTTTVPLGLLIEQSADPVKCSHCGYDLRNAFTDPPYTEDDKMAFVRHVMSDTGRFYKTYSLLGGRVRIRLRSRSQAELEIILQVARQQMKDDKLIGMGDLAAQLQRYHMVASIDRLSCDSADEEQPSETKEFMTLNARVESARKKDNRSPEDDDTVLLTKCVKDMDAAVFGGGRGTALFNTVMAHWMEFERLYGWFAAKAHDPDFWNAVGGELSS